jgi:hypothetical protein
MEEQTLPTISESPKKSRWWLWMIIALVIIGMGVGVWLLLNGGGGGIPSPPGLPS